LLFEHFVYYHVNQAHSPYLLSSFHSSCTGFTIWTFCIPPCKSGSLFSPRFLNIIFFKSKRIYRSCDPHILCLFTWEFRLIKPSTFGSAFKQYLQSSVLYRCCACQFLIQRGSAWLPLRLTLALAVPKVISRYFHPVLIDLSCFMIIITYCTNFFNRLFVKFV
jgi:hypothetical protein